MKTEVQEGGHIKKQNENSWLTASPQLAVQVQKGRLAAGGAEGQLRMKKNGRGRKLKGSGQARRGQWENWVCIHCCSKGAGIAAACLRMFGWLVGSSRWHMLIFCQAGWQAAMVQRGRQGCHCPSCLNGRGGSSAQLGGAACR